MASAEFAAVLEQFRSAGSGIVNAATLEEQRAGYEALAFPLPEATTVTPVEANGVPCEWIVAEGANPDARLAYLHGGGYVIGNLNTHRHLSAAIFRTPRVVRCWRSTTAWRRSIRTRRRWRTRWRLTASCARTAPTARGRRRPPSSRETRRGAD